MKITNEISNTDRMCLPAVCVIPATKRSAKDGGQLKRRRDLRVAAYCRVSTGDESQQTSYSNQRAYYADYINAREGWKLVEIYADEAISGTSRVHRKAFNRMMEDAISGRMDYIVTKSISRFARNTVDALNCVRQLRQQDPPVGIYFEKENIDTLDATGELILTILSALAQDESRSISENIRWTFQKNFQVGIPQINLKRMLGYDKGADGAWVINPEQAEIVRFIFQRYACGHSANSIARQANAAGMRTVNGKLWRAGAVLETLRNEKYVGDLEMQKTITVDFLTHRSIKNTGEAPKYYVKDHHPAIIDRTTWEKVQLNLDNGAVSRGSGGMQKGVKGSPFSNLRCGELVDGQPCGEGFFRMTYSRVAHGYRDARSKGLISEAEPGKYVFAYPVWRCKRKIGERATRIKDRERGADMGLARGGKYCGCPSTVTQECALEQSFMEALYWMKRDYEALGESSWLEQEFRRVRDTMCKDSRSSRRLEVLDGQIRELEDGVRAAACEDLSRNLRLRQEGYGRERASIEAEQGLLAAMQRNYDFFIACLRKLPEVNSAGMQMNVRGQDMQGALFRVTKGGIRPMQSVIRRECSKVTPKNIAQAPDYLRFERGIYAAFIQDGKVSGDMVEYRTTFGVRFKCRGNSRTLASFLGYRRCWEDGEAEILDATWKVNGKKPQYRCTPRQNKSETSS